MVRRIATAERDGKFSLQTGETRSSGIRQGSNGFALDWICVGVRENFHGPFTS